MERLIGWTKADAWGSTNAIPEFLGAAEIGRAHV